MQLSKMIENHMYCNWVDIVGPAFGAPVEKSLKRLFRKNAKQLAFKIVRDIRTEVNKLLDKEHQL